jgi:hypothetical protein
MNGLLSPAGGDRFGCWDRQQAEADRGWQRSRAAGRISAHQLAEAGHGLGVLNDRGVQGCGPASGFSEVWQAVGIVCCWTDTAAPLFL